MNIIYIKFADDFYHHLQSNYTRTKTSDCVLVGFDKMKGVVCDNLNSDKSLYFFI